MTHLPALGNLGCSETVLRAPGVQMGIRGSICPARYFCINYPDFNPGFTLP